MTSLFHSAWGEVDDDVDDETTTHLLHQLSHYNNNQPTTTLTTLRHQQRDPAMPKPIIALPACALLLTISLLLTPSSAVTYLCKPFNGSSFCGSLAPAKLCVQEDTTPISYLKSESFFNYILTFFVVCCLLFVVCIVCSYYCTCLLFNVTLYFIYFFDFI